MLDDIEKRGDVSCLASDRKVNDLSKFAPLVRGACCDEGGGGEEILCWLSGTDRLGAAGVCTHDARPRICHCCQHHSELTRCFHDVVGK